MRTGLGILTGCLVLVILGCSGVTSPQGGTPASLISHGGVNWPDPRDNFVDGVLTLAGLTAGASVEATATVARSTVQAFRDVAGARWVRLPVNPPTVASPGYAAFHRVVEVCLEEGLSVILCPWDSKTGGDGRVDDMTAFWAQWDTLVGDWGANPGVSFEVFNEPYGYTPTEWTNLAASWVANYPSVPRDRVLVGGSGYDDTLTAPASDPRLEGCRLSLHLYAFWDGSASRQTQEAWASKWNEVLAPGGDRVVVTEFGVGLSGGLDFGDASNPGDQWARRDRSYLRAASQVLAERGLDWCYWPGYRPGDSYSLLTKDGLGQWSVVNPSSLALLFEAR